MFCIVELTTAVKSQLLLKRQAEVTGLISWIKLKAACIFMTPHNGLVMVIMGDNIYLGKSEILSTKDV